MRSDKTRPLISFGTFVLASSLLAAAWLAYEHFGTWWAFMLAVPLAALVNIVGMVSPNGSVFWVFKESLQEHLDERSRK